MIKIPYGKSQTEPNNVDIVTQNGFVRKFYEVLKIVTGSY
jgi:hypothetical protein